MNSNKENPFSGSIQELAFGNIAAAEKEIDSVVLKAAEKQGVKAGQDQPQILEPLVLKTA